MANLTGVTTNFITAKEGFTTTLASPVSSAATTVPLNSTAGYADGEIVALTVDPGSATAKQVFTGEVSGTSIINVKWTEGTNQAHAAGATVIDYVSATHQAAMAKGVSVSLNQDGTLKTITANKVVTTSITDASVTTAKLFNESVTLEKISTGTDMVYQTWTPTFTGFSASPAGGIYRYFKIGKMVTLHIRQPANGTSNSTGFTISLPVAAKVVTGLRFYGTGIVVDNSVNPTNPGALYINPDTDPNSLILYKDSAFTTFTASGGKALSAGTITYETT